MVLSSGEIFLTPMEGKQNSLKYKAILSNYAVPIIREKLDDDFYFQQDNCSIHVSKEMKKYFATEDIHVIDWPARSPDLNIMENIWKLISDEVYSGPQPTNKSILRQKIDDAVKLINTEKTEMIKDLFNNFRTRLTKVLRNNGNIIN